MKGQQALRGYKTKEVKAVYFTGMNNNDIVLFETKDSSAALPVRMTGDEEVYFDAEDKVLPHEYFSDI